MNKSQLKATLILLLVAMIWGTSFIGQKVGMDSIGPFFFVAFRMTFAGIALIPVVLLSERSTDRALAKKGAPRTEEEKKAALRTGVIGGLCCGVVIYFANCLQQIGIVTTSAGKAAFITALYVILVPIVGIFLKHKTGIKVWIGAVLAVIGLYLLCITGGDFHLAPGDLIILICAFFWAFHVLVMDHFAPKANVALIVCVQSFTAGAIGFAVAFTRETFAWSDVAGALPSLLYVAIFCSAVAYTLQGVGQRDADPTVASIVMSLESVFAVISGFLLLHETLSSRELLGCVIMLIAIIIPQLPDKKSKTESAAA